ncbi:hypothetical protein PQX77_016383 [Marasmius sp. AFHP31]|nr:hypothetical protein PQX77_016383 [Marasmius sp. AFHP31]
MPSSKLCVWCGQSFVRMASHEYRCADKKRAITRARIHRGTDLTPASRLKDSVVTLTSTPAEPDVNVALAPLLEDPSVVMSSGMNVNANEHMVPEDQDDSQAVPAAPVRRMRQTRLPKRFTDFTLDGNKEVRQLQRQTPSLSLPPSPSQFQSSLDSPSRSPSPFYQPASLTSRPPSGSPARSPSPEIPIFISQPNNAGLYRIHRYHRPLNDIELGESTLDPSRCPDRVFGSQSNAQDIPEIQSAAAELPSHYPHPNPSVRHLMRWHHGSALMKSKADLDRLVGEVLLQPDFTTDDLVGFSAQRETDRVYLHPRSTLDSSKKSSVPLPFQDHDGWVKGEVKISLPRARNRIDESDTPTLTVTEAWHRMPYDVIRKEMSEPYSADFHLKPYKLFYKHPEDLSRPIQRVYGESYTSDRMLSFEDEIQRQLRGRPEGSPEVGIVAIMLYSDSTQLANFGDASLWPGYLTFANWSKYIRLKPSSLAMNHIIYFPSLPKTIQEHYQAHFDKLASDSEIRFCKVEMLHAVWHLLVSDPRFVGAYRDGYVENADYVEKKDQVYLVGTATDFKRHSAGARHDTEAVLRGIAQARNAIFPQGYAINNEEHVQVHLNATSTLAVRSCFSKVFQPLGLNHYEMFVPDSLHDLSGRISDLLKHNVRLINTLKGKKEVEYLDMRYRLIPTFGNGTIRRFKTKVSNFSRFASRDYQDALQCAMPCFEGLFPRDLDNLIQDLLFVFATYESYSSLRQHTDSTIATMKKVTKELGCLLRHRRKRDPDGGKDPQRKAFTLLNYKSHMLGHYPAAIVTYGTTDGTSTQAGEREHRRVKNKYQITNKNKPEGQIAALVMVEHRQKRMTLRGKAHIPATEYEELPASDPSSHHQLPLNKNRPMTLGVLLDPRAPYDPVIKDFRAKLYRHLISRILGVKPFSIPDTELYRLSLVSDRFYRHQRFRVYYTSYDCRRKKETIGYRRRPHIMTLANGPANSHPYLYGRVLGIYHADVFYLAQDPSKQKARERMEFLLVRWFEFDETYPWGWKARRLPRLYFPDANDADPFDFVDPAHVIRASHIIPAFEYNTTDDLLRHDSMARVYEEYDEGQYVKEDQDYRYYFVNMFPDTDMFMRYRGGGIGHLQFHEQLHELELEATAGDPSIPEYDINGDPVVGTNEVVDMEEDDEELPFEEMVRRAMEDRMDFSDDIDDEDSDSVDDSEDDEREGLSRGEDSGDESG